MSITHIFFDVHDVLVNRAPFGRCYGENLDRSCRRATVERRQRGGSANQRMVADWDSYYTDLDLSGSDGIADMWEGIFRTTRALFRLTGIPEPAHEELIALSRELPG